MAHPAPPLNPPLPACDGLTDRLTHDGKDRAMQTVARVKIYDANCKCIRPTTPSAIIRHISTTDLLANVVSYHVHKHTETDRQTDRQTVSTA